ncbi:MAG: UvrD-helicase domain-containing protein, partial [Lachnospiraceae bacterium]|nr:UvrD-helicase domain-containing protein [Lachnospiraceae bacterium]
MGINYTEDQLKVINTRDRNILVSAAAGSGKTAVLVQRIIKMIIDEDKPIDINRLLVVTFTKAAAKEMKDRIRSTLEGMLKENPSDDNISRQLSLLYEAQITTIDAFCQQVVKEHFSSIDLDPEFRVADEAELSLMKNDVLDEILEERFEEGDKDFLEFIDAYTTPSNNNKVREVIFSVYDYSRSMDKPEVWLHKCIEAFSYDNEDELINSAYFAEYMNLASWDIEELKTLISENLWIGSVGGVDEYFDNARADADLISTLINAKFEDNGKNRDETTLRFDGKSEKYYTLYTEEIKENPIIHFFKKIFNIGDTSSNIKEIRKKIIVTIDNANKSWSRLKLSKNSSSDLYLQIKFKENRDKIKKIVAGLSKSALFQPTEDILEGMEISKIYAKTLVSIVEDLSSKFSESKKAKGIIDFSDMERYALEILTEKQYRKNAYDNQEEKYEDSQLTNVDFDNGKEVIDNIEIEEKYKDNYILQPSTIAKEYEEYYEEILIDEYQDSNFLQEAILSSFARKKEDGFKNNMFMVGDVKQSIYGFRRAKPELFIEKYNRFTENSNEEMRIDLHKNFRSSEAVVNSVNMIFKRIMGKDLGGIDYDDRASLILGVDSIFTPEENENQTELLLINEKDMTLEEPDIDELNKSEMEGRVIADKIEKVLLETKVYDKNTKSYRKAMFGDIVILLRSLGELGDTIEKTLNDRGIPAIMPRKTGFSETPEIMVLTNYLRVLNNRYDDLSLTSLLTSVLCGLSDNELAKIKIFGKDETPHEFFQDVYRYAQMGEDKTIVGKLQGLLEVMDEIDQISMDLSTSELLGEILNKTNYYQLISLMPGGRQRVANVESFVEKAKNFERSGYKGLFNLIRFIDKMDKVQNDQGETNILDESIDAVRIMTIHKSKGLEFP